jgi:hypothetical protein
MAILVRRVLLGIVLYFFGPKRLILQKIPLWSLIYKYENTIEFSFLGLVKYTQGRTNLGSNSSFFRFFKNENMGLIRRMSYTEDLLSSSSSLKKKEVLAYLGGGKLGK